MSSNRTYNWLTDNGKVRIVIDSHVGPVSDISQKEEEIYTFIGNNLLEVFEQVDELKGVISIVSNFVLTDEDGLYYIHAPTIIPESHDQITPQFLRCLTFLRKNGNDHQFDSRYIRCLCSLPFGQRLPGTGEPEQIGNFTLDGSERFSNIILNNHSKYFKLGAVVCYPVNESTIDSQNIILTNFNIDFNRRICNVYFEKLDDYNKRIRGDRNITYRPEYRFFTRAEDNRTGHPQLHSLVAYSTVAGKTPAIANLNHKSILTVCYPNYTILDVKLHFRDLRPPILSKDILFEISNENTSDFTISTQSEQTVVNDQHYINNDVSSLLSASVLTESHESLPIDCISTPMMKIKRTYDDRSFKEAEITTNLIHFIQCSTFGHYSEENANYNSGCVVYVNNRAYLCYNPKISSVVTKLCPLAKDNFDHGKWSDERPNIQRNDESIRPPERQPTIYPNLSDLDGEPTINPYISILHRSSAERPPPQRQPTTVFPPIEIPQSQLPIVPPYLSTARSSAINPFIQITDVEEVRSTITQDTFPVRTNTSLTLYTNIEPRPRPRRNSDSLSSQIMHDQNTITPTANPH